MTPIDIERHVCAECGGIHGFYCPCCGHNDLRLDDSGIVTCGPCEWQGAVYEVHNDPELARNQRESNPEWM